jgi:hypothetical protein
MITMLYWFIYYNPWLVYDHIDVNKKWINMSDSIVNGFLYI